MKRYVYLLWTKAMHGHDENLEEINHATQWNESNPHVYTRRHLKLTI